MKDIRIGVISDTHYIPSRTHNFPFEIIRKKFAGVDLIIHAGDIASMEMLERLRETAPVEAVCGNMDPEEVSKHIPKKKVITFYGMNIGIVHGYGPAEGFPGKLHGFFEGEKLSAIVFGHTHTAFNRSAGGILYFNPGSPVKPSFPCDPSVGILTVSASKKLLGEIVSLL